jgi:hypothetical protein
MRFYLPHPDARDPAELDSGEQSLRPVRTAANWRLARPGS